jgi:hypothetical protein
MTVVIHFETPQYLPTTGDGHKRRSWMLAVLKRMSSRPTRLRRQHVDIGYETGEDAEKRVKMEPVTPPPPVQFPPQSSLAAPVKLEDAVQAMKAPGMVLDIVKKQVKRESPQRKELARAIARFKPPANWRENYDALVKMRLRIQAPVDTMGCERLADTDVDGKVSPV